MRKAMLDIHINPISINGSILPQIPIYHSHVVRTYTLEKNIPVSMIELERNAGQQRIRWLDEIRKETPLMLE